ncbi:uncharacterized protein LAJ45_06999 [Morchella importuna]|uniref:uncharacterized protein n=1 Tax=Morchella importuna TaxID=1174673 RepID=UPI001E8CE5AC|nr:uncharacterized protein LAJ45_06999 [Morchella importuna]KAH8149023.1 hypothetical protein LAJ45_06999 [Morchella importuna]
MVPDFMNWVGVDVDVGCGGFLGPTPLENLDGLEYGYRKPFWIGMRFGLDTFIVSLLEKSALEMQCLPSLRLDNVMDIDATSSGLARLSIQTFKMAPGPDFRDLNINYGYYRRCVPVQRMQ